MLAGEDQTLNNRLSTKNSKLPRNVMFPRPEERPQCQSPFVLLNVPDFQFDLLQLGKTFYSLEGSILCQPRHECTCSERTTAHKDCHPTQNRHCLQKLQVSAVLQTEEPLMNDSAPIGSKPCGPQSPRDALASAEVQERHRN